MNITTKIIVTDTNIITNLYNANVLDKFVMLDNVYISDMVKNDEIKNTTGNINIIKLFKTIKSTDRQLLEMMEIAKEKNGLSQYDILNFIIARDNNGLLATEDKKLKNYSENKGVEVIRTLKIISLMKNSTIISTEEAIKCCNLLKENSNTRIPSEDIENLINSLEKATVNN